MNSIRWADAPLSAKIALTFKTFSFTEKLVFGVIAVVGIISGILILSHFNNAFLVEVPHRGGSLVEGVIGSPRFINPVLAVSDADKDVAALVYSGLLAAQPDGSLAEDLAASYTISEDGLQYTVTLRNDIYFHDGKPLTTNDVLFTVKAAQNPSYRSPVRAHWDGIAVEKKSDTEIVFTLKQPYAPFIENLTLGILPEHIWKNLDADQFSSSLFNTEPVGSGPFEVKKIKRNSAGLPVSYELRPFTKHANGEAYIGKMIMRFYTNEEELLSAYQAGDIESINGIHPQIIASILADDAQTHRSTLPRSFGIFFNQNHAPLFVNKEVRQALDLATPKQLIVDSVLDGFGVALTGPLASSTPVAPAADIDAALALLTKNGWTLNEQTATLEKKIKGETVQLSFTLATGNAHELKEAAQILHDAWAKVGAHVEVNIFETSDLNQEIIRPRKFDALLFGEVIGRDYDLYPFWHSSQRNDPGLNIAQYVNSAADKLLSSMRETTDSIKKQELYKQLESTLAQDVPAIFLYSPDFIYITPEKVHNLQLQNITDPTDRFMNVEDWYVETNKVWKIFVDESELTISQ